jgi:hypothetical protein
MLKNMGVLARFILMGLGVIQLANWLLGWLAAELAIGASSRTTLIVSAVVLWGGGAGFVVGAVLGFAVMDIALRRRPRLAGPG